MHLITFRASDQDQYKIIGAWDPKDAICSFLESRDDLDPNISMEMFRLMIKSMSVGEAIVTYNTLSSNAKITAIYDGLHEIDIKCDL